MKKFNAKLVLSSILIAAVASMSAVSVSADYYSGYTSTTTTPAASTDKATEITGTVTDSSIKDVLADAVKAGKKEVTIELKQDKDGKASVNEAAIAELKKAGVTVTFNVTTASGIAYTAKIDPAKITEAKSLNLAMDITVTTNAGKTVSGVEIPAGAVVIEPQQKGQFGLTIEVSSPAIANMNVAAANASVFYISDDGEVTNLGAFTGSVAMSHASAYVVSIVDLAKDSATDAEVAEDDDKDPDPEDLDDDDADDDDEDDDVSNDVDSDDDADEDETVVNGAVDSNPGTGVGLSLGALAVSAAAVMITAKKRK